MKEENKPIVEIKEQTKNIKIDIELVEILDKLKEKIIRHGWGALNPSYADVSRVLARKIKASNLL